MSRIVCKWIVLSTVLLAPAMLTVSVVVCAETLLLLPETVAELP